MSFRQLVLPYVVNAGLSSLVFSSRGAAFLLSKPRKFDLFFTGTLDRFNCGFLVRNTIGIACKEYAHLAGNQSLVSCGQSGLAQKFDQGIIDSKFCFAPRGDSPSSSQVYNAMAGGCVPIIISDDFILPFGNEFPYDRVSVRLRERDFLDSSRRAHFLREVVLSCWNLEGQ